MPTTDPTTLGPLIKSRRIKAKVSQRALARAIAMKPSSLGNIESGKTRQPTPANLEALAKELGLDFAQLMRLAGHPFPGHDRESPLTDPFADLTDEEVDELREYLAFLRWRDGSAGRD